MDAIGKPQPSVLWLQVWGLAAVQGAIALMWVIYNLYLPRLLGEFGFPAQLTVILLLVENLLGAVMEPMMGTLSDRQQQWIGSRLPFISAGVIGAASLFIAVPAVANWGGGWLLPTTAVVWAIAMTVFRSPALSLLGRYAFGSGLPKAASILTLVGALAGALAPFASQEIVQWGPTKTFGLGSIVLLLAAAALQFVDGKVAPEVPQPIAQPISWARLGWVFATGICVAIGFRLMMQTLPALLKTQPGANVQLILGMIFLSVAATAIPAGSVAVRLGNARAMILGLGTMAVCLLLVLGAREPVVSGLLAIALGASFSLVSNGTIPFALAHVPPTKAGLGTGVYFGGGAIGVSAFFGLFSSIAPGAGAIGGALAFALAGLCVHLSFKQPRERPSS
jgi:Major Facilitator Superfamily/MFS/sugar transport protein